MKSLKENFYKNNGLSINTLTEGIVTDTEKVSLQKAIKLLTSYASDANHEEMPKLSIMIQDIIKDLQSIQQKI